MNVGEVLSQAGLGDPVAGFLALFAAMGLGVALAVVAIVARSARPRRPRREPREPRQPSSPNPAGGVVVKGDMMLPATAYQALRDLSGCRGVLVVESGRILCVTSDEEAIVVWPPRGETSGRPND